MRLHFAFRQEHVGESVSMEATEESAFIEAQT